MPTIEINPPFQSTDEIPKIMSPHEFAQIVEREVKNHDGSYLETITTLCTRYGLAEDEVVQFITPPIKEKLRAEGIDRHLLPPIARLPI